MKYLLIKSIYSFDGTFNEYELINIDPYEKDDPVWYLAGIEYAINKIYSHLQHGGKISPTYKHYLAKKIKTLVDGENATRSISQYSSFEITQKRHIASMNNEWEWKLYDYQLIFIGGHGSDFDISGILSQTIYKKLKSLKESISRVTNIEYESVCIKMHDGTTYELTEDKMSEYESKSDFMSWRGVKTIDSVLSLNHLVHEKHVGEIFKIPGANYKFSNESMSRYKDKTVAYDTKFNKLITFDISGNEVLTLHEKSTGILFNIPKKEFNYLLKLA